MVTIFISYKGLQFAPKMCYRKPRPSALSSDGVFPKASVMHQFPKHIRVLERQTEARLRSLSSLDLSSFNETDVREPSWRR
jgi:hypothetical protein